MSRQPEPERTPEPEVINPSSLELIQRAEIDMQVMTANRFPRGSLSAIKEKMLSFATLDEDTAASCFYSLPRGNKTIQGPSVRLAEIAVYCYKNLRAASRVVGNDGRLLTSQAACHDLENNTLVSVEVQRRITDKNGNTFNDDMQAVAGNAANSIAFRNAVFKVIPGVLWRPVYDAAKLVAIGTVKTLAVKREKIISRLNAMHVTTPMILAKLSRSSVEDIDLADLETLIGLGTAMKDGDTTPEEAFATEASPQKAKMAEQAEQARKEAAKAEAEKATASEHKSETKPEAKPETKGEPADPTVTESSSSSGEKQEVNHVVGRWADQGSMLNDFKGFWNQLGEETFMRVLGNNGLESPDVLSYTGKETEAAFLEMADLVKPKQTTSQSSGPAPEKPVFGKKGRS